MIARSKFYHDAAAIRHLVKKQLDDSVLKQKKSNGWREKMPRWTVSLGRPFATAGYVFFKLTNFLTISSGRVLFRLAHSQRKIIRPAVQTCSRLLIAFAFTPFAESLYGKAAKMGVMPRIYRFLIKTYLKTLIICHLIAGNHVGSLRAARFMNVLFRPEIRAGHTGILRPYLQAYFSARIYEPLASEFSKFRKVTDATCARLIAQAMVYAGNIAGAFHYATQAVSLAADDYNSLRIMGLACYLQGDEDAAKGYFFRSAKIFPQSVLPHHNYAARNSHQDYVPQAWELREAGQLVAYDLLNQSAEEAFLTGKVDVSMRYYQKALDHQAKLAQGFSLPADLLEALAATCAGFDPAKSVRILPNEWVTQFGHIGLLDAYIKMARLGLSPEGNHVLLAPPGKVANEEFLRAWEPYFLIVRDKKLCDKLFPYIRYIGENFMAASAGGEYAELWTHKAARAQVLWAQENRPALLSLSGEAKAVGSSLLRELGIGKNDWFVGLHVREGGFYSEAQGGGSGHRNSSVEDYFPAIREIVRRGGKVVRLGDRSMKALPAMDGLIDYAHSNLKSPDMDLFLLASCRFVIGTTSGLTTATLSFGTPMVLVNCISNDPQLWSDKADFILKKVYSRRLKRYLTFAETFSPPVQGMLINNVLLETEGYEIHDNTADEVSAAVAAKLNRLDGIPLSPEEKDRIAAFEKALAHNPYNFGAARPVAAFVAANPFLLEAPVSAPLFSNDNQAYCPPVAVDPAALPGK